MLQRDKDFNFLNKQVALLQEQLSKTVAAAAAGGGAGGGGGGTDLPALPPRVAPNSPTANIQSLLIANYHYHDRQEVITTLLE